MTKGGVSARYGEHHVFFGCTVQCMVSKLLIEIDGEKFNVTETLSDDR